MRVDKNDYEANEFLSNEEEEEDGDWQDHGVCECDGCKYWSELCAQQLSGSYLEALCLNPLSPYYSKMASSGCVLYVFGTSVDCPIH